MKLSPDQSEAVKAAFAEIEVAARAYETDRTLIRDTAPCTRARLLQIVRKHHELCASVVPAGAAELRRRPEGRAAFPLGDPGQRRNIFAPIAGVIEFVEIAPKIIAESLAEENVKQMGWSAVLAILAVFESAGVWCQKTGMGNSARSVPFPA